MKSMILLPLIVAGGPVAAAPTLASDTVVRVTGHYWSGPEEHRLDTATDSLFVTGPAARALDRLLADTAPPGSAARIATVTVCGALSSPGRYGHMGRHRRQIGVTRLLRVVDPRGRVLLDRPGRC